MCVVALVAVRLLIVDYGTLEACKMTDGFRLKGQEAGLSEDVADWKDKTVTVTGCVYRKDTKYFYLDSVLIQIQAAGQQQNFSLHKNLICEYKETAPRIGSSVKVLGTFRYFSEATNPGEFDSAGYYASIGIDGKLTDVMILTEGDNYSAWKETLFGLRAYFQGRLYRIFPDKEASVMTAMLLGDKSGLDGEIKRLYQDNGIIHILSISGLHITIIGMSIYKMLRRAGVPVWIAALVGGMVLVFYGVMTGMSISACRAIGMFLIKMLAEITGRTYDMLTAMGVMAAGMVGVNPLYLQNAGFLLSFGAILGIGVLYPVLLGERKAETVQRYEERTWKRVLGEVLKKYKSGLKQSMLSGLSVTLTTLPILLWFYYQVPTYSVLLNLLVIPFMTLVMLTGLIAMLVPGLGIVGTVDCIILGGYEWLCRNFGQLPFSAWNPGRPEVWQVVAYYGLIMGVLALYWYKEKMQSERRVGFAKYIILTIAVIVIGIDFPEKTTVTFLDVGQGDCICVQLDSGEVYLFDCGSSSRSGIGEYVLLPYLRYRGIKHIDAVFVSHPDEDHCNGVKELLANGDAWGITVGALILPDVCAGVNTQCDIGVRTNELQELVEAAKSATQKKEIVVSTIKAGNYWERENCRFLCLHPSGNTLIADSNAYSQCFYIELEQGLKLLLTGDVEDIGEELLLEELQEREISDISVLKVAHHGSKYSTGEALLQQVQPRVAVISCGRNNSYGHPHEETLARLENVGSTVLTTPEYGAVTIEVGKRIEVYTFTIPIQLKPPRS